jgi:hypothetical protein
VGGGERSRSPEHPEAAASAGPDRAPEGGADTDGDGDEQGVYDNREDNEEVEELDPFASNDGDSADENTGDED